ncbi:MAG TPA: mechanosensitive ion channel family protein [Mariprofundaceae bacterium]|nr:mechanosensitive ion channel family protein [Mariprofundaceae bacterium]
MMEILFGAKAHIVRSIVLIVVGFILAKVASTVTRRFAAKRFSVHHATLARRIAFYTVLVIFAVMALHQLGFDLGVLLGAAGIFSVAIGFASQTAASNLISGLFLIGEKTFSVKDVIKIGDTIGEVLSIDLLSIKLRTFDNLFVRIPNEAVMKSEVTTLTRFPIRRADIKVGVAYREDIGRVRDELMRIAAQNPLCLDEPEPLFIFLGFGDSSLDIQFSVWTARENFLALKNSIQEEIKVGFDAAGIEIPFPHRSLYAGSETEPFPVRVVDGDSESSGT